jgi:hypothetical protein
MVPGVPKLVTPENRVAPHKEQRGHRPRVANRPAARMAFQRGTEAGQPHPWSEHLALSSLPDPEGRVEPLGSIGKGVRLWPVAPEEIHPLGNRALVDEQDRRIRGIGLADSA